MALFRRLFYRKPPDRLLEISERVYGTNACFFDYVFFVAKIFGTFVIDGDSLLMLLDCFVFTCSC